MRGAATGDEDGPRAAIDRGVIAGFSFKAAEGAGNFAFILGQRSPRAARGLHSTQSI